MGSAARDTGVKEPISFSGLWVWDVGFGIVGVGLIFSNLGSLPCTKPAHQFVRRV